LLEDILGPIFGLIHRHQRAGLIADEKDAAALRMRNLRCDALARTERPRDLFPEPEQLRLVGAELFRDLPHPLARHLTADPAWVLLAHTQELLGCQHERAGRYTLDTASCCRLHHHTDVRRRKERRLGCEQRKVDLIETVKFFQPWR